METRLIKELLRKLTSTALLIERTEYKKQYYVDLIAKYKKANYPVSSKDKGLASNGLKFSNEMLTHLEKRFLELLDKINAHSIDNIKT